MHVYQNACFRPRLGVTNAFSAFEQFSASVHAALQYC
jgi:hypothetical protein